MGSLYPHTNFLKKMTIMQRKEDELLHAPTVVGIWKHLDLPRTYAVAEERGQSSEALGHTDMPGKDQAHVAFRNMVGIDLLVANRDSPHYKWARNLIKKDIGAIKLNTNLIHGPTVSRPAW